MPKLQHMREILSGPLTGGYLESKTNEGWKAVAVIWEREVPDDAPPLADIAQPVPYGLKIAEDCVALEQDMRGAGSLDGNAGDDRPGQAAFGNRQKS